MNAANGLRGIGRGNENPPPETDIARTDLTPTAADEEMMTDRGDRRPELTTDGGAPHPIRNRQCHLYSAGGERARETNTRDSPFH